MDGVGDIDVSFQFINRRLPRFFVQPFMTPSSRSQISGKDNQSRRISRAPPIEAERAPDCWRAKSFVRAGNFRVGPPDSPRRLRETGCPRIECGMVYRLCGDPPKAHE
jgi:hypothetical protein